MLLKCCTEKYVVKMWMRFKKTGKVLEASCWKHGNELENLFTNWANINFSKIAVCHGVSQIFCYLFVNRSVDNHILRHPLSVYVSYRDTFCFMIDKCSRRGTPVLAAINWQIPLKTGNFRAQRTFSSSVIFRLLHWNHPEVMKICEHIVSLKSVSWYKNIARRLTQTEDVPILCVWKFVYPTKSV
jgi:hypothetical protein